MLLATMKQKIETLRAQLHANVPWKPFKGKYIDLLCDRLQYEVEHVRDLWQQHAEKDIHAVIDWLLNYAQAYAPVPWYMKLFTGPILDAARDYLHANADIFRGKIGYLS